MPRRLHQVIDGCILKIAVLKNERLPHIVVRQVPQIFGSEGGGIDAFEARVSAFDDVLFNESHPVPSIRGTANMLVPRVYRHILFRPLQNGHALPIPAE